MGRRERKTDSVGELTKRGSFFSPFSFAAMSKQSKLRDRCMEGARDRGKVSRRGALRIELI